MLKNKKYYRFIVLGVLIFSTFVFHELYEFAYSNLAVGLIAPVSESLWEHGKIIFFPFVIISLIEYFVFKPKEAKDFWASRLLSASIGVVSMIVMYYVYTGVTGTHSLIADVIIGFISVIIAWYLAYYVFNKNPIKQKNLAISTGLLMLVMFFVFTYFVPTFGMFLS